MAKVDFQAIMIKVSKSDKFKREALNLAQVVVKEEKEKLLEEFDNHPVTRELEDGPTAANTSGTLSGLSDRHGGNLFSFIGFPEGYHPVKIIRDALKRETGILNKNALFSRYAKGNTIEVGFRVQYLSIDDLDGLLDFPSHYEVGNILEKLEKGRLRGLSHYIYDEEFGNYGSVSGTGLEAKTKGGKLITIRDGDTNNAIPYVEKLLKDFALRLRTGI